MLNAAERDQLRHNFATFASTGTGASTLYRTIGTYVHDSAGHDVLDLFDTVAPDHHRAVNLLAGVHFLVLSGVNHPLSSVFRDPDSSTLADSEMGDLFTDFCRRHSAELIDIMQTRSIQTNEVNRSASLVLALDVIAQESDKPLALIDLGAGVGLNLLFDEYRIEFDDHEPLGPTDSQVTITASISGPHRPPHAFPVVDRRIGIDLNPIDPNDADMERWLQSSIWAGENERSLRLTNAMEIARRYNPEVRRGDVATVLPGVVDELSKDFEICLFNSWMMGWCTTETRHRIVNVVGDIGRTTPLWWITFEDPRRVPELPHPDQHKAETSILGLHRAEHHGISWQVLARSDHHGQHIEWLADERSTRRAAQH